MGERDERAEWERDERAEWLANWLMSWEINIGERDMPQRLGTLKRGGAKLRHIDYILATTQILQLGMWAAMHTRSDHMPARAAVMARSGEVIRFSGKAPTRLLGYVPDPSAARRLARRWAEMHPASLAEVRADLERAAEHIREHEEVSSGRHSENAEPLRIAEARKASLRSRLTVPDVADSEKTLLGRATWRIRRRIRDKPHSVVG